MHSSVTFIHLIAHDKVNIHRFLLMMDMKKNLKKRKEKSSTLENNNKTKKINVDNT